MLAQAQALGILYTVNTDGQITPHTGGSLATFSLLYNIMQRKSAKSVWPQLAEEQNNLYNYFALQEPPPWCNVAIFSPESHCLDSVDLYLITLAPDMYSAEKSMQYLLSSKTNINSKEIPIDTTADLDNNLLFKDYPKYKLYFFKVSRGRCVGSIHKLLNDAIVGTNIVPICKDAA